MLIRVTAAWPGQGPDVTAFDRIVLIFNPQSTGDGPQLAEELHAALDRHPRIGERAGAGHDAEFSAREQGNVDHGDDAVITALATGNRAYEERFGHVFLIRASGRSTLLIRDRRICS